MEVKVFEKLFNKKIKKKNLSSIKVLKIIRYSSTKISKMLVLDRATPQLDPLQTMYKYEDSISILKKHQHNTDTFHRAIAPGKLLHSLISIINISKKTKMFSSSFHSPTIWTDTSIWYFSVERAQCPISLDSSARSTVAFAFYRSDFGNVIRLRFLHINESNNWIIRFTRIICRLRKNL